MTIGERMADAIARVKAKNGRGWRLAPKAFYLSEDDLTEFMATHPPMITAVFRNKPRQERGFDGIPVRAAGGLTNVGGASRLYTSAGTSLELKP